MILTFFIFKNILIKVKLINQYINKKIIKLNYKN